MPRCFTIVRSLKGYGVEGACEVLNQARFCDRIWSKLIPRGHTTVWIGHHPKAVQGAAQHRGGRVLDCFAHERESRP